MTHFKDQLVGRGNRSSRDGLTKTVRGGVGRGVFGEMEGVILSVLVSPVKDLLSQRTTESQ